MRRILPLLAALLSGCGYVAGPLPRLANIPERVTDLAAVQRGGKLIVQFTAPHLTTEGVIVKQPPSFDLRIGPGPVPFSAAQWASAAKRIPPVVAAGGSVAHYAVPCAEWTGTGVTIAVRVVGANGKDAGWSGFVNVDVIAPPDVPTGLRAEMTRSGLRLSWHANGSHFRVLRALEDAEKYEQVAEATAPEWTDPAAQIATRYRYLVQTFVPQGENRAAESDLSAPLEVTPEPMPPAAPTGLRAVAAPNSIELAWDPAGESAVKGYRVYRAPANGAFGPIADTGAVPTYSDHTAEHGKTYRYAVAAIGTSGKEGAQSAPLEIALP
ncbi:MAG: fibronectin type III domain-containing protein [Bryobacteraceae bacterium]